MFNLAHNLPCPFTLYIEHTLNPKRTKTNCGNPTTIFSPVNLSQVHLVSPRFLEKKSYFEACLLGRLNVSRTKISILYGTECFFFPNETSYKIDQTIYKVINLLIVALNFNSRVLFPIGYLSAKDDKSIQFCLFTR